MQFGSTSLLVISSFASPSKQSYQNIHRFRKLSGPGYRSWSHDLLVNLHTSWQKKSDEKLNK